MEDTGIEIMVKEKPAKGKAKAIGKLAIVAIVIVAIVLLIIDASSGKGYYETEVFGLDFNVPSLYDLVDSGGDSVSGFRKYEYEQKSDDSPDHTYYLLICVWQDMTVDEVVSALEFDDGWEIVPNITYGNYTGVRADIIVLPFRNTVPQWFFFEKEGKSVAVFLDNQAHFKKGIETIISGGK